MRRRMVLMIVTVLAAMVVITQPASAGFVGRNGRIAFVRANQIYTIQPNGTGQVRLTTLGKNYRPKWSPDGKRIAYIHEASATSKDIWFMNADGSGKNQVTHAGAVSGGTWAPDGRRITFGATPGGSCGGACLYLETMGTVVPYTGPTILQGLYDPSGQPEDIISVMGPPVWSPDGKVITYASGSYPDSPDRYLLSYHVSDGSYGNIDVLEMTGGACCGEDLILLPQYSPSGATLTTTWTPVNYLTYRHYPTRIRVEFGSPVATKLHDSDATFSPDGNKIAVTNDSSGTAYIFIQTASGTTRTKLTAGYTPDWQSLH